MCLNSHSFIPIINLFLYNNFYKSLFLNSMYKYIKCTLKLFCKNYMTFYKKKQQQILLDTTSYV